MPNRILHERLCGSETIDQLTADEERFWNRLLVQCDDYGRFDARPAILLARCFPLKLDTITTADVAAWLSTLVGVGLVELYEVDGRRFLHITTWDKYQQTRAKASKFPEPADGYLPPTAPDSNGNHVLADAGNSPRIRIRESQFENRESGSSRVDAREAPGGAPPNLRVVPRIEPQPVAKPTPKPTPVGTFLDAVKALDPELVVSGDRAYFGSRLKLNPEADLALMAEAYVSFQHREWPGSKKLQDTGGDPVWLIGDVGAYAVWKRTGGKVGRVGTAHSARTSEFDYLVERFDSVEASA